MRRGSARVTFLRPRCLKHVSHGVVSLVARVLEQRRLALPQRDQGGPGATHVSGSSTVNWYWHGLARAREAFDQSVWNGADHL